MLLSWLASAESFNNSPASGFEEIVKVETGGDERSISISDSTPDSLAVGMDSLF